jgi:integrase
MSSGVKNPKRGGRAWIDTGLVFTTRHGTPIEPRNFNRSFDRRIVKAKVSKITVHGAHKTCGSLLAALDVHPRVAMQILRLPAPCPQMCGCWLLWHGVFAQPTFDT